MNICKIVDGDYPWDIRVEKICDSLVGGGHEVFLVCRNVKRSPVYEYYEGIHIFRLPYLPHSMGRLNYYATFPAFFSPLWMARVNEVVRAHSIDCIMVRDLPLALTGIAIGKLHRIPVVVDMAECYPEMLKTWWEFGENRFTDNFVRSPRMARVVEKITVGKADYIIAVVEESKDRFVELGVPSDKISIVSNTPNLNEFHPMTPTFPGSMGSRKDTLVMLYVGLISMARGLDFVIRALPRLLENGVDATFVVVGRGGAEERLRGLAREFGVTDRVFFEGYVAREAVPDYVASSDICLIPYPYCSHWAHTIPNKLFDYMAMSKPVIVSDVEPMRRIVRETECGVVYKCSDGESFYECVQTLRDERTREKMGKNGERAVRQRYNWGVDSTELLALFERFSRDGGTFN